MQNLMRCLLLLSLLSGAALSQRVCSIGEIFAGAPDFTDPMQRAVAAQGLRHPAAELQLRATQRIQTAGSIVFLAYKDGSIYLSDKGLTPYVRKLLVSESYSPVMRIACYEPLPASPFST